MSLLTTTQDPSLWRELWDHFYETYFAPENVYYPNLNMNADSVAMIRNIVIGLMIGVIIASFAVIIDKRVLGAFVRKLLSEECLSPESAKRLCDLGFDKKYVIKNGVRRGTNLRAVVKCREEEEYNEQMARQKALYEERRREDSSLPPFVDVPYRVDADADHFYIPEEKKYAADLRFEKKGTTWLIFAMIILVSFILLVAFIFLLPEMLEFLDSLVGSFNNSTMGGNNVLK